MPNRSICTVPGNKLDFRIPSFWENLFIEESSLTHLWVYEGWWSLTNDSRGVDSSGLKEAAEGKIYMTGPSFYWGGVGNQKEF